jgi:hydrogenase-4 component E
MDWREAAVNELLNLLIGLAMGLNLVALGTSRLPSLIRVVAFQGVVLGVMPLVIGYHAGLMTGVVAVATVAMKGIVIPTLLRRAMRAANIDRDLFPIIGLVPSLLLGATGMIGAVMLTGKLPLLPEHRETLLVAGALATGLADCCC